jgi:hypothetical protein
MYKTSILERIISTYAVASSASLLEAACSPDHPNLAVTLVATGSLVLSFLKAAS